MATVPLLPPGLHTVAIDGGTTNTRARLLRGEEVVAEARRPVGARDVATKGDSSPLASAVADAIAEVLRTVQIARPDRIVACGMLTSEVGLHAVPHATAPAGLDELVRATVIIDRPDLAPVPIVLVPGVRTPAGIGVDGWARADVMRGEECETLGWWYGTGLRPPRPARLVWTGSHAKLVALDPDGRITASHTTLSGELIAAVASGTILASSLPRELPRALDPEAAEAGARLAAREGLGRAAFLVRIAALSHHWSAEQRAAFWIAAVAADDMGHLARHPLLESAGTGDVHVGGPEPLRSLYTRLLGEHLARPVHPIMLDHASALGAALVAQRHAELTGAATAP